MAGIAIIVKDMSFADSNLGQVTFAGQTIPITGIAITNSGTTVPLNASTLTLTVAYTPANTTQKAVTWSITSGGTYATINQNGVVTLRNLVANAQFTVKVQSAVDATINATKTFTVVSSNMIENIKAGYKVDASSGEFVENSSYISTDWINTNDVSLVVLDLATTVEQETTARNCKIGIFFEDNSGSYHDVSLGNSLVSAVSEPRTDAIHPFILPVREMKKISLYSYSPSPTDTNNLIRCNTSDWQAATLNVVAMKNSGTETYGTEIINKYGYAGGGSSSSMLTSSSFTRFQTSDVWNQFIFMIKAGETVSLKTETHGTGEARAWSKWTLDGVKIDAADQGAAYTESAYTFTADQDMFFLGSCTTEYLSSFELVITKSS